MFGNKLKNKRKELGLKQKDLAVELGLTTTHLCQLENEKSSPTLTTLIKWCEYLGCKLQVI